ncbi:hypothetical protein ACWGTO_23385 [Mesorhizobium sp. PL10]
MTTVNEDLGNASEVFSNDLPTRPKLGLGRFLCRAAETYASAVRMAYGPAIGFRVEAPMRRFDEDDRK